MSDRYIEFLADPANDEILKEFEHGIWLTLVHFTTLQSHEHPSGLRPIQNPQTDRDHNSRYVYDPKFKEKYRDLELDALDLYERVNILKKIAEKKFERA